MFHSRIGAARAGVRFVAGTPGYASAHASYASGERRRYSNPGAYFCIKAFSETDQTEDLGKIDVPTLILHGDDDQVVPIGASGILSSKLIDRGGAPPRTADL